MQLIAETYDLLKRGLGWSNEELQALYAAWSQGELNSFLVEITAQIFRKKDDQGGAALLVDQVLGVARQKGTGQWTSQDALDLHEAIPTIDAAVTARNLSAQDRERAAASKTLTGPDLPFRGDRNLFATQLRNAFFASVILTYSQGMDLLRRASQAYGYGLQLGDVARIWRGGCIIRAALLEDIRAAYQARPDLLHLLLDPGLAAKVNERQADLRTVVATAAQLGLPAPALMASLAYLDSLRHTWLPANLIQAQRDLFGAHTYERIDRPGTFHSHWE
jgi:6-phosphogluconate dehydrogenase